MVVPVINESVFIEREYFQRVGAICHSVDNVLSEMVKNRIARQDQQWQKYLLAN